MGRDIAWGTGATMRYSSMQSLRSRDACWHGATFIGATSVVMNRSPTYKRMRSDALRGTAGATSRVGYDIQGSTDALMHQSIVMPMM